MRSIGTRAALLAALAAAASCAGSPDVKLGALVSLSGVGAGYGNSIKNGIELAVEEINAAGGVNVHEVGPKPLTLLLRDAASNPATAVQHARELIEAGVPAVIGSDLSDITLAIAPLFQEAEVVLLSPSSSSPKLTQAGEYIFRNFPSDELEALNTADYIYNKRGLREAAVIANQNEFGIGTKNAFIERFRMLGGRVLGQTTYPSDASDLSAQVREIMALDVPAIYIAGYTADTVAVVRALHAAGEKAQLFATGALQVSEVGADDLQELEGVVFPQPSFDPDSDEENVRTFVARYREKYGMTPDTYAAHGYDAAKILALAFQEAGTDPREIRFYLHSMDPYPGVAGATDFNDNGDVRKFHRMYRIEGGRAVPIDTTGGSGRGR